MRPRAPPSPSRRAATVGPCGSRCPTPARGSPRKTCRASSNGSTAARSPDRARRAARGSGSRSSRRSPGRTAERRAPGAPTASPRCGFVFPWAPMRRVDAVIFDLDGLIIDSETPEVMAWTAVYARYGMEFPVASWLQNVGRNDRLWDPLGPFRAPGSPAPPDTVAAIWREQADAAMAGYFTPLPGVVPLLTALRQRGV